MVPPSSFNAKWHLIEGSRAARTGREREVADFQGTRGKSEEDQGVLTESVGMGEECDASFLFLACTGLLSNAKIRTRFWLEMGERDLCARVDKKADKI